MIKSNSNSSFQSYLKIELSPYVAWNVKNGIITNNVNWNHQTTHVSRQFVIDVKSSSTWINCPLKYRTSMMNCTHYEHELFYLLILITVSLWMCLCSMKNVLFFIFTNRFRDWYKNVFWYLNQIYTSNKNQIATYLKTSWLWNFFMIFIWSTHCIFLLSIYVIIKSYLFFYFCVCCIVIYWKKKF